MMPSSTDHSLSSMARIEELVRKIESLADPTARSCAIELVQALMEFHGSSLERLLEMVAATENGLAVIDRCAGDDLVGSLLLLYGLHPLSIEARVGRALDKVRPYLESHGGNVRVIAITEDTVRLRLEGSCKSCPSSTATMKLAVEDAIYAAAPDVVSIETEGLAEGQSSTNTGFIQIGRPNGRTATNNWHDVPDLVSFSKSCVQQQHIAGRSVVLCQLGDALYAYEDDCPNCGNQLGDASLDSTSLICKNCRQRYDVVRAGRGLDQPHLHLEPLPLLFEQGRTRIALAPLIGKQVTTH